MVGDNWRSHMVSLAREAAEQLTGTCRTLADLGEEFEAAEDDSTFSGELDSLVFCCVRCNWWCEQDEMSKRATDEWFCTDCEDD